MDPTALILTDDRSLHDLIVDHLRPFPLQIIHRSAKDLDAMETVPCDFAVVDLPGQIAAARWVPRIKEERQSCQILLLTPGEDPPNPEDLESWGVRTWLGKPVDHGKLLESISRAVRSVTHRFREAARPRRDPSSFDQLIGHSPALQSVIEMARKGAQSPGTTILIRGETGTGKQLLARAIHESSPRSGGPFLDLNCAALPSALLESELFGHEKGAFTGATRQKPGLLELADGGTVFLDEIGDLDLGLQAKLLKFLDQRSFRRVQGLEIIHVDVRFLTATHTDLAEAVRRGTFRRDLYHRLNVLTLELPPLRTRAADIPLLADHFLKIYARKLDSSLEGFSPEALEALQAYPWPGNVRELDHVLERSVLLNRGRTILAIDDLPPDLVARSAARETEAAGRVGVIATGGDGPEGEGLTVELPARPVAWDDIERAVLQAALAAAGGNVSGAARRLGLGRGQLRYRMGRLGIEIPGPARYRPRRRMRRRKPQPPRAA